MDKVKKFLELHVQWVAIALGAAFLLYTVYAYVISHPVTAAVGPSPAVAPGDIDQKIWDDKGKTLEDEVNSKDVPTDMPKVADMVSRIHSSLEADEPVYAMTGPYSPLAPSSTVKGSDHQVVSDTGKQVAELPKPPAILDLKWSGGHTNVVVHIPPPVGPDGQPVAGAPAPEQQPPAIDKTWRTIMGRIPVSALAQAFKDAKIPSKLYSTTVFRVELIREEQDAAGQFPASDDQAVVIPPLASNPLLAMPGEQGTSTDWNNYQQWVETNYITVMQPPFYEYKQGDVWYVPGLKNPNDVQLQLVVFDPSTFKGDPSTLSPEDRKVYDAWKKKQQQDAAAARRAAAARNNPTAPPQQTYPPSNTGNGNTGNTGGNGNGGGRGRRGGVAEDPDRPPAITIPPPPGAFGGPGGIPGMVAPSPSNPTGPNADAMAASTAAATAAAATLPHGSFDPSTQGDITVWAHDDTVQAGKTYRYKLRYIIANPVARSEGLCANPQDAKTYKLVSLESAWTDQISVEAETNFYAVNATPSRNEVSFDVFHWKDGNWQMQTVKVTPGDMVGTVDGTSKADFTTGWTLVDVRTDPRDESQVTILLASANGTVLKKDKNTDLHDGKYRQLLDAVKQQRDKEAKEAPKTAAVN